MEPRTEAHLATAQHNHDFARALLEPAVARVFSSPPLEWAVVVAFYAAVHYVNAYLWERQRYEPRPHDDRENAVTRAVGLRPSASPSPATPCSR